LDCAVSLLTSLDVSNCIALKYLDCRWNKLTTLDLSKNTSLGEMSLGMMPSLYKVCVWAMPFPPTGVITITFGSPNLYFTMDCSK